MRLLQRLLAALALTAFAATAFADVTLDPPNVTIVDQSREWITLRVVAGPSGLPGGFSVWWMKTSDYNLYGGWMSGGYGNGYVDGADFTGAASLFTVDGSEFVLGPGQEAEVRVGYLYDETGAAGSHLTELPEGTGFTFHAYALGAPGYVASSFGATLQGGTSVRTTNDCTFTQGFWKNHPEAWTRVTSMVLGTVTYTNAQLQAILGQPANGNGLVSLAHQLIAAQLNILLGASAPPSVVTAINQANALIGGLIIPPITGAGFLDPSVTDPITNILDQFNSGQIGPGHCPDSGGIVPATPTTWGRIKTLYR